MTCHQFRSPRKPGSPNWKVAQFQRQYCPPPKKNPRRVDTSCRMEAFSPRLPLLPPGLFSGRFQEALGLCSLSAGTHPHPPFPMNENRAELLCGPCVSEAESGRGCRLSYLRPKCMAREGPLPPPPGPPARPRGAGGRSREAQRVRRQRLSLCCAAATGAGCRTPWQR